MKEYSFWINVFVLTFLLGVGAVIIWFTVAENTIEAVKLPLLLINQNCVEPKNFPALAVKITESQKGESGYFPKEIFSEKKSKEADNFLNKSLNSWYGKHLKAMDEKSLLDINDKNKEVYRFLWLRTFHHPIFVRIERNENEIKLFTKELNGGGGYEPRDVFRSYNRNLDESEWCSFLKLIRQADYWKMSTKIDDLGTDGSIWILEGVKDRHYHIVDRFMPKESDYGKACIYMLKLSGIDTDKLGNDLY